MSKSYESKSQSFVTTQGRRPKSRGVMPFFRDFDGRWRVILQKSISVVKHDLKLDPLRGEQKPIDSGDDRKTACRKLIGESFRLFHMEPECLDNAPCIEGIYLVIFRFGSIDVRHLQQEADQNIGPYQRAFKAPHRSPPLGLVFPALADLKSEPEDDFYLDWVSSDFSESRAHGLPKIRVGRQVCRIIEAMKRRDLLLPRWRDVNLDEKRIPAFRAQKVPQRAREMFEYPPEGFWFDNHFHQYHVKHGSGPGWPIFVLAALVCLLFLLFFSG